MTINQLSYLITIAETGSLNKAAELLYISQPSLSGAVQELERSWESLYSGALAEGSR